MASDPTLEERARALLLGNDAKVVARLCLDTRVTTDPCAEWSQERWWDAQSELRAAGCLEGDVRLTPLGRAVAELLASEVGRGE